MSKKVIAIFLRVTSCFVELYWKAKIDVWNQENPNNPITSKNLSIDHIKPVAAFKTFLHGNPHHYTNLQPLTPRQNLAKQRFRFQGRFITKAEMEQLDRDQIYDPSLKEQLPRPKRIFRVDKEHH